MASDDKIEELIREIAGKHGIAVSRDDPILILQTINSRLMQESSAAQQEHLAAFKSELELVAQQWDENAKVKADRSLTAALAASQAAMTKTMQDGASAAGEAIRRQMDASLTELRARVQEVRRLAVFNVIAAALVVVAAALAVWASR